MRYQITGQGWPLGDMLVPAGTVIGFASSDHFSERAKGRTIPINATPLDDEAYQAQRAYANVAPEGLDLRHLLGPPPPGATSK